MSAAKVLGPFKLVSVNNVPERAKRVIGRIVEELRERYTIVHVGNADSIEQVRSVVEAHKPDLLFTASMWTPEESQSIIAEAKTIVPNVKTFAIPQGLQAQKGPDGVVEYVKEHLPEILES